MQNQNDGRVFFSIQVIALQKAAFACGKLTSKEWFAEGHLTLDNLRCIEGHRINKRMKQSVGTQVRVQMGRNTHADVTIQSGGKSFPFGSKILLKGQATSNNWGKNCFVLFRKGLLIFSHKRTEHDLGCKCVA